MEHLSALPIKNFPPVHTKLSLAELPPSCLLGRGIFKHLSTHFITSQCGRHIRGTGRGKPPPSALRRENAAIGNRRVVLQERSAAGFWSGA